MNVSTVVPRPTDVTRTTSHSAVGTTSPHASTSRSARWTPGREPTGAVTGRACASRASAGPSPEGGGWASLAGSAAGPDAAASGAGGSVRGRPGAPSVVQSVPARHAIRGTLTAGPGIRPSGGRRTGRGRHHHEPVRRVGVVAERPRPGQHVGDATGHGLTGRSLEVRGTGDPVLRLGVLGRGTTS